MVVEFEVVIYFVMCLIVKMVLLIVWVVVEERMLKGFGIVWIWLIFWEVSVVVILWFLLFLMSWVIDSSE